MALAKLAVLNMDSATGLKTCGERQKTLVDEPQRVGVRGVAVVEIRARTVTSGRTLPRMTVAWWSGSETTVASSAMRLNFTLSGNLCFASCFLGLRGSVGIASSQVELLGELG